MAKTAERSRSLVRPARGALSPVPARGPKARPPRERPGLPRRVTADAVSPQKCFDQVEWTRRPAKISGADGEVVFKMDRRGSAGHLVPACHDVRLQVLPQGRRVPTGSAPRSPVRQLVRRVAHTLRSAGERWAATSHPADAGGVRGELTYMLVHQIGAVQQPRLVQLRPLGTSTRSRDRAGTTPSISPPARRTSPRTPIRAHSIGLLHPRAATTISVPSSTCP